MSYEELWDHIAAASERWYAPPDRELLSRGELELLFRRASGSDATPVGDAPRIAFPSAVPMRSVDGITPYAMGRLFFSPLVLRLNYVAQLSTTYMGSNIDAKHCRLSHSLGTLAILSTLLEILITRMKGDDRVPEDCWPSKDEIVGAFTYAALHDAFQGPFGHALDSLREELIGGLHGDRRLDKTLLMFVLSLAIDAEEGRILRPPAAVQALSRMLHQTVCAVYGIPLLRLLKWLHHASINNEHSLDKEAAKRRQELCWLYELLEGPLDADRWDYLWRDTLHLGFVADHEAIRELLWEFWADVRVVWDGTRSHVAVSQRLSPQLGEVFFPLRKKLYKQVYENPEKRLVDAMLVRAVYLSLLAGRPAVTDWNLEGKAYFEFLCNLAHVTDADLLSVLDRAIPASNREKSALMVHRIVRSLGTYPAVKLVWQGVLRDKDCKHLVATAAGRLERFTYRGVSPPSWTSAHKGEVPQHRVLEILKQTHEYLTERSTGVVNTDFVGSYAVSLALHSSIMPIRPARNLQFERVVWKLIKAKPLGRDLVEKISRSVLTAGYEGRSGDLGVERVMEETDLCPPIFVSFPWVAGFSEAAMREMTRERSSSSLHIELTNGSLEEVAVADLMPESHGSETYVAVGGYPLFTVQELEEAERTAFDLVLIWAIRRMLEFGCCLALPRDLTGEAYDHVIVDFILSHQSLAS